MNDDERRMYELEYPTPEIRDGHQHGPTLVVALQGYADAGQAVEAVSEHLLAALENRLVASFNTDELVDFRSRRPAVTMEDHEIIRTDEINLDMRVLRDPEGRSFLLLSGPEPDMHWNAFTEAVTDLVERYDVENTICLYSAPMTVPHTRPLVVSAHGNAPGLVGRMYRFDGKVVLPGSAALRIEAALARAGRNVAGYTAHVPHYVAASPYPAATLNLLRSVADATDLDLPLRTLEHDARRVAEQLAEQTDDSGEIQQVVRALEEQYDEAVEKYREAHPRAVMPGEADLPSGEELGAEFERFLARLDEPGEDGGDGRHGENGEDGGDGEGPDAPQPPEGE